MLKLKVFLKKESAFKGYFLINYFTESVASVSAASESKAVESTTTESLSFAAAFLLVLFPQDAKQATANTNTVHKINFFIFFFDLIVQINLHIVIYDLKFDCKYMNFFSNTQEKLKSLTSFKQSNLDCQD